MVIEVIQLILPLFGVPQGSILRPLMLNIYMADLQTSIQSPLYQFMGDTMNDSVSEMNGTVANLSTYSIDSHLSQT